MSIKIKEKAFMIALILAAIFTLSAGVEQDITFDPFGSDTGQSDTSMGKSGPIIPQVEFSNNDISMAFQIISDATGWSIFPTANVSRAKISLWAKNIPAGKLLDTIVTLAGFIYHREGDVITVMTYEEYMQHHGLAKKVFALRYATGSSINAAITPFLTKLGKSVVHKETNTVVLYESDANLEFITAVIEKLDSPATNVIAEVVNLKYADCEDLAKILQSVFSGQKQDLRNKTLGEITDTKKTKQDTAGIKSITIADEPTQIYAVIHTNQLLVVGTSTDVEKVKALVSMVDVYCDNMVLEVIDLKYADSEVLAETLQQLFQEGNSKNQGTKIPADKTQTGQTPQKSTGVNISTADILLSPESKLYIKSVGRTNQLIIKAFRTDLEKLRSLIEKLDRYIEPLTQNYQLTYVDASEIFNGLEKILDFGIRSREPRRRNEKSQGLTLIEKTNSILLTGPPSAHRIMTSIMEEIDKPGTYESGMIRIYKLENADVGEVAKTVSDLIRTDTRERDDTTEVKFAKSAFREGSQPPVAQELAKTEEFVPQIEARVSLSKSTSSIVVQATAKQHRELEKLIKELDTRRRQVLIEAMIVEVTNTDNLSLGVELSHASIDALAFSAFGLSTNVDPVSGTRDIIVSPGATAAVLRPDKIQAIIQTLKQDGNAKITSAPRILVNDNAVGFTNSIAEEPTTQTNLGETTTTTSFAGFVEAGTQFAITPHISENDYLRVEYEITLNSFGTKPTDPSIPPPRNTSSIHSEATVPNGFTIVVGGLQTTEESENVDKVPLLGDIPILEWVFKNTKIEKQYKTTYLFITPHIMESEDFTDLKEVSKKALEEVEFNSNGKEKPDGE